MRTDNVRRLGGMLSAGAITAVPIALAGPAAAQQQEAEVGVSKQRLQVRAGSRALVTGRVQPASAGTRVALQVRRGSGWKTLRRDTTGAGGRYVLRKRLGAPVSAPARLHVSGAPGGTTRRSLGRVNVFRTAYASWYGPGFYGQRTGCGGTLRPGELGVANKSLPCGSKVTFRHNGRTVRVPVIDRGPYVGAREYDLTEATADRLGFRGHGSIQTTR
jgi:rare lipoprotein A